jgi:hypothetical protein
VGPGVEAGGREDKGTTPPSTAVVPLTAKLLWRRWVCPRRGPYHQRHRDGVDEPRLRRQQLANFASRRRIRNEQVDGQRDVVYAHAPGRHTEGRQISSCRRVLLQSLDLAGRTEQKLRRGNLPCMSWDAMELNFHEARERRRLLLREPRPPLEEQRETRAMHG